MDLSFLLSSESLVALGKVLMINIVLSGDNAIIIGMVAARCEVKDQRKVILWGMAAAVILRILFAIVAVELLDVLGLMLAGGIILLWVAWRLYRDIQDTKAEEKEAVETVAEVTDPAHPPAHHMPHVKMTLSQAIVRVAIADVAMSVDNVLAIAGAAADNLPVMIIGLIISVALMGMAATFIARLLQRYHWLSYVGVVLIVWVAGEMIWNGSADVPALMQLM